MHTLIFSKLICFLTCPWSLAKSFLRVEALNTCLEVQPAWEGPVSSMAAWQGSQLTFSMEDSQLSVSVGLFFPLGPAAPERSPPNLLIRGEWYQLSGRWVCGRRTSAFAVSEIDFQWTPYLARGPAPAGHSIQEPLCSNFRRVNCPFAEWGLVSNCSFKRVPRTPLVWATCPILQRRLISRAFPGVHGAKSTCVLLASFLWSVRSAATWPSASQLPKFDNISHLPSSLHRFSLFPRFTHFLKILLLLCK